jgi:hypothetical protein
LSAIPAPELYEITFCVIVTFAFPGTRVAWANTPTWFPEIAVRLIVACAANTCVPDADRR